MTNRQAGIIPMRCPIKPAILIELTGNSSQSIMGEKKWDEGDRLCGTSEFRHRRETGMDRGCCRQTVTSKMTTLVEAV